MDASAPEAHPLRPETTAGHLYENFESEAEADAFIFGLTYGDEARYIAPLIHIHDGGFAVEFDYPENYERDEIAPLEASVYDDSGT